MRTTVLPAVLATFLASAPCALANDPERSPSGAVVDVRTAALLSANSVDAVIGPSLAGRLSLVAMAIDDIASGKYHETSLINEETESDLSLMDAISSVCDDPNADQASYAQLASEVIRDVDTFHHRFSDLTASTGMRSTILKAGVEANGTPSFDGSSSARDIAKLAVSLVRAHRPLVEKAFGPATGYEPTALAWMHQGEDCLLVGKAPKTGRVMASVVSGVEVVSECFNSAATMITEQDNRLRGGMKSRDR